jgi:tetratricopeptide (TPR) repeat protein
MTIMVNKEKKISNFQLVYVISGLAIIGLFLLFVSGLFDSVEVKNQIPNVTNNNSQPNTPTVDLQKINEINNLEEIVKNNPQNYEALLSLGHLLNDNGYYDRAVVKYEQYLKVHPENVDVIVDMGVCYFELKKYDKSISVIESAVKINPKHQIANFNLGIVNFADGNVIKAKEWWKKAMEINPNSNIGTKAQELLKTNN